MPEQTQKLIHFTDNVLKAASRAVSYTHLTLPTIILV